MGIVEASYGETNFPGVSAKKGGGGRQSPVFFTSFRRPVIYVTLGFDKEKQKIELERVRGKPALLADPTLAGQDRGGRTTLQERGYASPIWFYADEVAQSGSRESRRKQENQQ